MTYRLATIHTSQTTDRQTTIDDRRSKHCRIIVTVRTAG